MGAALLLGMGLAALLAAGTATADGIWTSKAELAARPTSGAAWDRVLQYASMSTATPLVSNQDDDTDVRVLAKALVYARTGQDSYRQDVIRACIAAIGTEAGGR